MVCNVQCTTQLRDWDLGVLLWVYISCMSFSMNTNVCLPMKEGINSPASIVPHPWRTFTIPPTLRDVRQPIDLGSICLEMESEDRSVTGIILQTSPLTVTPLGREKSVTVSGEICTTNLSRRNPLSRPRLMFISINPTERRDRNTITNNDGVPQG